MKVANFSVFLRKSFQLLLLIRARSEQREHDEVSQIILLKLTYFPSFLRLQTEKRLYASLLAQESSVPERRLLLEKAQRRQDDEGRSHEAESSGHRGESREVVCEVIEQLKVSCFSLKSASTAVTYTQPFCRLFIAVAIGSSRTPISCSSTI